MSDRSMDIYEAKEILQPFMRGTSAGICNSDLIGIAREMLRLQSENERLKTQNNSKQFVAAELPPEPRRTRVKSQ